MLDITTNGSRVELEMLRRYLRIPMTNGCEKMAVTTLIGSNFKLKAKRVAIKGKRKLVWDREKKKDGIIHTFMLFQRGQPVKRLVYQNGKLIEISETDTFHRRFEWGDSNQNIPSVIIEPETNRKVSAWIDHRGRICTACLEQESHTGPKKDKKPKYIRPRPA